MRPDWLMKTGAAVAAIFALSGIVAGYYGLNNDAFWFNAVMGGAVFGKGYGVWEERNR